MKVVRYGAPGNEQPGLLDAEGQIRSLSGIIGDVAGLALEPDSLGRIARIDPQTLPRVDGNPRLGPCVGLGMKPRQFLQAGDVMRLGVAGLGEQQQRVAPFA